MISIVVPIYNIEKYLDRCLDCIIHQTYSDYEVILVDNNSNELTLEKEEEWLKRDNRITRVFQTIQGLGPARNKGVESASGEYITFIDPDDWWDLTYLEKLFNAISKDDADICMCDRLNYEFRDNQFIKVKYPVKKPIMMEIENEPSVLPEMISMIEVSVNGKLFKRELFDNYDISTPNCSAEDRAIMHYIIYKAKKVTKVNEALYFYHAFRSGSLVSSFKAWSTMPECMQYQIDIFKNDPNYDSSLDGVLRMISVDTAIVAVNSIKQITDYETNNEAKALVGRIKETNLEMFPRAFDKQFIIGSYALRREVWLAYHDYDEIRIHQQFSSLISLMSGSVSIDESKLLKDNNRKQWRNNDLSKEFLNKLDDSHYIFIDFLEERYDIGKKQDAFFTWSELYDDEIDGAERILRSSVEVEELWKNACLKFIEFLKKVSSADKIVLVRNYLCEKHGEYKGTALFLEQETIKSTNKLLDCYYDFFENNFPGIHVVTIKQMKSLFSDESFGFGCTPYHANEAFYHEMAYEIRKIILPG